MFSVGGWFEGGEDVEGHWVMGESKGALAANTSLVVVISGRYARPRSRSVLEDVGRRGRRTDRRSTVEVSRGRGRPRTVVATRDLEPIIECWFQLIRRDSPIASAWTALMSGGAKVTWSPHTCAYNRKRSLFHYKSVY